MESEEARLLTAIVNNPDDDTARPVYADFETPHGSSLPETPEVLIRVLLDRKP
jgi:uncharacterized protein (TIGR02996 family)